MRKPKRRLTCLNLRNDQNEWVVFSWDRRVKKSTRLRANTETLYTEWDPVTENWKILHTLPLSYNETALITKCDPSSVWIYFPWFLFPRIFSCHFPLLEFVSFFTLRIRTAHDFRLISARKFNKEIGLTWGKKSITTKNGSDLNLTTPRRRTLERLFVNCDPRCTSLPRNIYQIVPLRRCNVSIETF